MTEVEALGTFCLFVVGMNFGVLLGLGYHVAKMRAMRLKK